MHDLGNMEQSTCYWQEQMAWTPHREIYRMETPSSAFKTFGTRHNHRIKCCYDQPFQSASYFLQLHHGDHRTPDTVDLECSQLKCGLVSQPVC